MPDGAKGCSSMRRLIFYHSYQEEDTIGISRHSSSIATWAHSAGESCLGSANQFWQYSHCCAQVWAREKSHIDLVKSFSPQKPFPHQCKLQSLQIILRCYKTKPGFARSFPKWTTTHPSESSLFIWEMEVWGNGREELIKTLPAVRQRQAEILFLGQNHWVLLPAVLSGCLPLLICNSGLSITAGKERRQPGAQVVCGATTSRLSTCVSSAVEPVSSCDNTQGLGFVIFLSATCTSSTSDEMKAIIWEENMLKNIENYSEVEKSISLKTQRMK